MRLYVDRTRRFQTMEGFGVSGAWWAQSVGKWTAVSPAGVPAAEEIARLLFDRESGAGIGIYRYNLGAGSAGSGRGDYADGLRRAESFYTPAGPDYTKDAAAVKMMRLAVAAGAEEIVLFVNSPIEQLTVNHKGHTDKSRTGRTNLRKKDVPAFAAYCLDAAEHFVAEGLPVRYISPVNEPLWVWNGGQEGCHYTPRQCAYVMRAFAGELRERPALSGVKLAGFENGDIRWFNKSYTRALLGDPSFRDLVDGVDVHSYFLNDHLPFLGNRPAWLRRFRAWMDRKYPGVPVRVSEWCHMCGGRHYGIDSALVQAKVMLEDLTLLNAASFQGWIACSPYDYCDGLIYIDPATEHFDLTARYYAFGNFSKFIRPGAVRVAAKTDDPALLTAAFEQGEDLIFVLVNPLEEGRSLRLKAAGRIYVTTETEGLAERAFAAGEEILIPPASVNTLILPAEAIGCV